MCKSLVTIMISRTSFVVILKGFVKKSLRARIICFNMLASRARFSTRTQTVKYENSDSKKSAFFGKFGKKNHFFRVKKTTFLRPAPSKSTGFLPN